MAMLALTHASPLPNKHTVPLLRHAHRASACGASSDPAPRYRSAVSGEDSMSVLALVAHTQHALQLLIETASERLHVAPVHLPHPSPPASPARVWVR